MRSALFILLLVGMFKVHCITWPEGSRWTQEYLTSDGATKNISENSFVKINREGFAVAVWKTRETGSLGNIYVSERNSKGVWSFPIQVNSKVPGQGSNGLARSPRVALNDQGEAVVTWLLSSTNNNNIYVSTRSASGVWSAEQQINSTSGGSSNISDEPKVAMNEKGQAVVTWLSTSTNNLNIYVSTRSASGTWSAEEQVNITSGGSSGISQTPQVAMNERGQAVVTWYTSATNNLNIYVSTRSVSGEWGAEQQVNSSSGGSSNISWFPEVAMNERGQAVVTWYTSVTNNLNVYVSSRSANGTWSAEQQINSTFGGSNDTSFSPQVAMNDRGEAVVSWYTSTTNNSNIYVSTRSSNGVWSDELQISSSSGASTDAVQFPQVAMNERGQAVVTWYTTDTNNNDNIYVSTRSASGDWSAEQQVNSMSGGSSNISWFSQVAINESGQAVVVWYTSATNNLNVYASSFYNLAQACVSNVKSHANVSTQTSTSVSY